MFQKNKLNIQTIKNVLEKTLIQTNENFKTNISIIFEVDKNSIKANHQKFKIKKIYKILKEMNKSDVFIMRWGRYFEENYAEQITDIIYTNNILAVNSEIATELMNSKSTISYSDGDINIEYNYTQPTKLTSTTFCDILKDTPRYLRPKIIAESHTVLKNSITIQYAI